MGNQMIEGLVIQNLTKFEDERGAVLHMVKTNTENSIECGEIYFSLVKSNVTKGWKLHKEMTQNFCVPVGEIRFVLYDNREGSSTKGKITQIDTGYNDYKLIKIPPGIWYSFKSISDVDSLIANCASIPHKKDEAVNIPLVNQIIPYTWN